MMKINELSPIISELENSLEFKRDNRSITPLHRSRPLPDSQSVFFVHGQPRDLVVMVSPKNFSDASKTSGEKALKVCEHLDHGLSYHVASPAYMGHFENRAFSAYWRSKQISDLPLLKHLQKRKLRQPVSEWITQVGVSTKKKLTISYVEDYMISPLTWLNTNMDIPTYTKLAAKKHLEIHSKGQNEVFSVLTHGDLWYGNVMVDTWISPNKSFQIIDWGGSSIVGYPVADILQFTLSISSNQRWRRSVLGQYLTELKISPERAEAYLLASLGALGQNREEFPYDKYLHLVNRIHSEFLSHF